MRHLRNALLVAALTAGIVLVGLAGPAGAVQVSNEAELKTAFASDTQIDIEADITLTDCTGGGAGELAAAVTDPVTVDGHGHTVHQTCPENVFIQDGSGLLTVRNLTITGGHATGNGGGIFSAGPLTLTNTTIAGNRADAAGGGIGSQGATTLTDSTVDPNISSGVGGGISLGPNGPGSLGSGIFSGGSTTLVYATVVRNQAAAFGNIDTTTLETFGSVVAEGGTAGNCLAS